MTGRTHDLAAFTALSAVVVLYPPSGVSLSTLLLALFMNQIGGAIPDIDQPTAPLWRNLPAGSLFGRVFNRVSGGHRFITHSVLGVVLFGFALNALLTFLGPILGEADTGFIWWAFIIGMVSHLVMDTFTKEGVPFLLPLPIKFGFPPIRHLRITTGKKLEQLVVFPGLLVICTGLFAIYYDTFVQILRNLS